MQCPLLLLLVCNLVIAIPLRLPWSQNQRPLLPVDVISPAQSVTQHLERIPKSAELLFTASDDDQMIHVWLPLGKRIYTRDYPILPLHPTSARIVNVLGLSAKATARDHEQQVTCIVTTETGVFQDERNAELRNTIGIPSKMSVVFQESDGVVRLNEAASALYLSGKEVESYECF